MQTNLLYRNRIEESAQDENEQNQLVKDLKMEWVLECMAQKNTDRYEICKKILTIPLTDMKDIIWRQEVVQEVIRTPEFFCKTYENINSTIQEIEEYRHFAAPKYNQIVKNSKRILVEVEVLKKFMATIVKFTTMLKENTWSKTPLVTLNSEVQQMFSPKFIEAVQEHIAKLEYFKEGECLVLSGHIGLGFRKTDFILNEIKKSTDEGKGETKQSVMTKLFGKKNEDTHCIKLEDAGLENSEEQLEENSLEGLLKVLVTYNKKVMMLFKSLKLQFGFYSGCHYLYEAVVETHAPWCFPEYSNEIGFIDVHNLMDIGLVLKNKKTAIGNDFKVENKNLCMITGANQGGKTTFLRSIGLSVAMAQSGLFVCATYYKASIFKGLFTHFPSEEDAKVSKGLLEMELGRMSDITKKIKKGSILLMNESFATTTEREGGQIAEEVTRAFRECGIFNIFVTHLFEYAHALYEKQPEDVIFYKAGKDAKGERTYRIEVGEPVAYGNGVDLI